MFKEEGLRAFLAEHGDLEPTVMLEALREALRVWTGVEALDDDLTMIAIRKS
jgi:hypothetical protein